MTEWQPVTGYEDAYEVSRCGLVRKRHGAEIGQWLNDQGYKIVRLSGPRKMLRVHRIVAHAFVPNPYMFPNVNHLDHNRSNNHADNLEWCTQKHNLWHARKCGRMSDNYWAGRRSPNASLTDKQAEKVRSIYKVGNCSFRELSVEFGVSRRAIGRLINGETYTSIPEPPHDK